MHGAADRSPRPVRLPSASLDWVADGACLVSGGGQEIAWRGAEVRQRALHLAGRLRARLPPGAVVGSLADNSPQWLIADLALLAAGMTHVPLPSFFSREQLAHAVRTSGMHGLICADAVDAARLGFPSRMLEDGGLACHAGPEPGRADCRAPEKITFTSGTTGTPKGVLLSAAQQFATVRSLLAATAPLRVARHLCLLPLPVLLENVAGAWTALASGAECVCPALETVGMLGASGFDAQRCLNVVATTRADSLILLPQMLHAMVGVLEAEPARRTAVAALRFVAVGGARTPPSLIERARRAGLPVFEGYGLSECASVVSLNLPGSDRPGSVGRPLPGVQVRLAADGEVEVRGRGFDGYLGSPAPRADAWLATGDLGSIDEAGFLTIVGRKKHVLVTGYGRNVSPEWPEGLLTEHPGIAQAVVFGEARPFLGALLYAPPRVPDALIAAHVASVNARLPDYARIGAWTRAAGPFTPHEGLATHNGRVRRDAVHARYADAIGAWYETGAPAERITLPET